MHFMNKLIVALAIGSVSHLAAAASNPISVHVLNLQTGLPSAEVEVTLEKLNGERWSLMNTAVTNSQGRIVGLLPQDAKLDSGTYRVTFKTGKWFAERRQETFFPEIPVIFTADGSVPHYHVPLLVSQYGYSTYRGN